NVCAAQCRIISEADRSASAEPVTDALRPQALGCSNGLEYLPCLQILNKGGNPQLCRIPIRSCCHCLLDISMASERCNRPDPFTHNVIMRQGHAAIFAGRNP